MMTIFDTTIFLIILMEFNCHYNTMILVHIKEKVNTIIIVAPDTNKG